MSRPGDVQDPVVQPLRFAELVLAVEREQLRPDHHVVRGEREFEPRRVRLEGVERQAAAAGRLQCHDPVLYLRVLAVGRFKLGEVRVVLVGDEALKPMPVGSVNEAEHRGAAARDDRSSESPQASLRG